MRASLSFEALQLARPTRSAPTHDVRWDFDSWDLTGQPCVETGETSAESAEQAEDLAVLYRADLFKRNVRVVPRVRS